MIAKFLAPSLLFLSVPIQGAIVATEVGNNAPGTDGTNEYAVILNNGLSSVDLTGYGIADSNLSFEEIGSIELGSQQSLVVSSGANRSELETAWEQTIPSGAQFTIVNGLSGYNNSGTDQVVLQDAADSQIYTFEYTASLGSDSPPTSIALGPDGGSGGTSATPFSTVSAVPEPTVALLGMLGLGGLLRRRRV